MGPVSGVGTAQTYSSGISNGLDRGLSQLSSGSRIPNASFDAAGLAVNTRLTADQAVLRQGAANAAQGAAIAQVADGGLARSSEVLSRLGEIAAQSLSGTATDSNRSALDAEFQQLLSELDGIAETTRFNGESLLDGTSTQFSGNAQFQVGTEVGDTIDLDTSALSSASDFTANGLGLSGANVLTQGGAQAALAQINQAQDTVSEARASTGAIVSRFESRGDQIATSLEGTANASSSINDTDLAETQSDIVSLLIQQQANIAAQSQANQNARNLAGVLL